MSRFIAGVAVLAMALITVGQLRASNLVINGDFESGNVDFTSGYTYTPSSETAGDYFIGPSPYAWNNYFTLSGDHTTGSGNMMLVDGSTAGAGGIGTTPVWEPSNPITVTPNTTYIFSGWMMDADSVAFETNFGASYANLEFSINGVGLGTGEPSSSGIWQPFSVTWNSSSSTSADLMITDLSTVFLGNDFALDDISFTTAAVPEPTAIIVWSLLGGLGISIGWWRRRKAA